MTLRDLATEILIDLTKGLSIQSKDIPEKVFEYTIPMIEKRIKEVMLKEKEWRQYEFLRTETEEAITEAHSAVAKFGDFASLHEAYAVLLEKVDELKDEMRKKQRDEKGVFYRAGIRSPASIRKEALDVAAVALRIAVEAERMAMK